MPPVTSASIARATMLRSSSTSLARNFSRRPIRSFTSTPTRTLAHRTPETEHLNEAQRYLADKAARKAQRTANPTGASARHASLYSQLFPALLRILAYGSSAYFGLHLLWNVLDREEQTRLMNAQTEGLEATAKSIAQKLEKAKQHAGKVAESTVTSIGSQADRETGSKKRWYWPF